MKLSQYPQAIASQEQKLLEANKILEFLLNDLKAKELELGQSTTYQGLKALIHNQTVMRNSIQIKLGQLSADFSIAKLEDREGIASLKH